MLKITLHIPSATEFCVIPWRAHLGSRDENEPKVTTALGYTCEHLLPQNGDLFEDNGAFDFLLLPLVFGFIVASAYHQYYNGFA